MTTPALLASEEILAARASLERMAAPDPVSRSRTALLDLLEAVASQAQLTESILGAVPGQERPAFTATLLDQTYTPAVRAARTYAREIL